MSCDENVFKALDKLGDMDENVVCPNCSATLRCRIGVGKRIECEKCRRTFIIPSTLSTLLKLVHSPDDGERRNAIDAIGNLGDPSALTDLCAALMSGIQEESQVAARSLAKLGTPEAFDALRKALVGADDYYCPKYVVNALRERGDGECVMALEMALKELPRSVGQSEGLDHRRLWVVKALGEVGGISSPKALLEVYPTEGLADALDKILDRCVADVDSPLLQVLSVLKNAEVVSWAQGEISDHTWVSHESFQKVREHALEELHRRGIR